MSNISQQRTKNSGILIRLFFKKHLSHMESGKLSRSMLLNKSLIGSDCHLHALLILLLKHSIDYSLMTYLNHNSAISSIYRGKRASCIFNHSNSRSTWMMVFSLLKHYAVKNNRVLFSLTTFNHLVRQLSMSLLAQKGDILEKHKIERKEMMQVVVHKR